MRPLNSSLRCQRDRNVRQMVRAAALVVLFLLGTGSIGRAQQARPDFRAVNQAVEDYFKTLPEFQAGDLIHHAQVEEALARVKDAGWDVKQREEILKRS